MNEISPLDYINHILRHWWMATIAMCAGGLLGWAISFLLPPIYEASALYSVTLDEKKILEVELKTNPQAELDFTTINAYLEPVDLAFFAPETREALVKKAEEAGIDFSETGFNTHDFDVDRRGWDWIVTVRHPDAETAARLANFWMQVSDARLQELRKKSVEAAGLELQGNIVRDCFVGRSLSEANLCAGTAFPDSQEASKFISNLDEQSQSLRTQSLGIREVVFLSPVHLADVPLRPVMYPTGLISLIGAFLGFIAGAILIQQKTTRVG